MRHEAIFRKAVILTRIVASPSLITESTCLPQSSRARNPLGQPLRGLGHSFGDSFHQFNA